MSTRGQHFPEDSPIILFFWGKILVLGKILGRQITISVYALRGEDLVFQRFPKKNLVFHSRESLFSFTCQLSCSLVLIWAIYT